MNRILLLVSAVFPLACVPLCAEDMRLAAGGYCLVSTVESDVWIKGEPTISSDFRGLRFYFLSGGEKAKFDASPKIYAPAIDGNDPVCAADEDKLVPGTREFAVRYKDRTYFFSTMQNMERFVKSPHSYTKHVEHREHIDDKLRQHRENIDDKLRELEKKRGRMKPNQPQ